MAMANLVAFHSGITEIVDKGRATDIIHLDLCKACDTVPQDTLVAKLEKIRFGRWPLAG